MYLKLAISGTAVLGGPVSVSFLSSHFPLLSSPLSQVLHLPPDWPFLSVPGSLYPASSLPSVDGAVRTAGLSRGGTEPTARRRGGREAVAAAGRPSGAPGLRGVHCHSPGTCSTSSPALIPSADEQTDASRNDGLSKPSQK